MSFKFYADEVAFRECRTLGRKKTAAGWRCAGCHQAREQRKESKEAA